MAQMMQPDDESLFLLWRGMMEAACPQAVSARIADAGGVTSICVIF